MRTRDIEDKHTTFFVKVGTNACVCVTVDPNEGPALAGSLSRVLCYLHKIKQRTGSGREKGKKPRILCLQASTDVSVQYISFMNAIFSAEVTSFQFCLNLIIPLYLALSPVSFKIRNEPRKKSFIIKREFII